VDAALVRHVRGGKSYGVARSWVYTLLARYQAEGEAAFEPRELQAAALIVLPSPASRTAWDRGLLPELPVWITRTSTAPTTGRDRPEPRVWPGVLEAAGRIASRTDEHEVLDRIASWLRDGPYPAIVPVEERSLELFDDEKRRPSTAT
jgi:hypothetical protein